MNKNAETALTALGHTQVLSDRCTAIETEKPLSDGRPKQPPIFCGLKHGHEGKHFHLYGTNRYALDSENLEFRERFEVCKKCGVRWPCKDAEKVIAAFDA